MSPTTRWQPISFRISSAPSIGRSGNWDQPFRAGGSSDTCGIGASIRPSRLCYLLGLWLSREDAATPHQRSTRVEPRRIPRAMGAQERSSADGSSILGAAVGYVEGIGLRAQAHRLGSTRLRAQPRYRLRSRPTRNPRLSPYRRRRGRPASKSATVASIPIVEAKPMRTRRSRRAAPVERNASPAVDP